MVAHEQNPTIWEAEAEESVAWGQPRLYTYDCFFFKWGQRWLHEGLLCKQDSSSIPDDLWVLLWAYDTRAGEAETRSQAHQPYSLAISSLVKDLVLKIR